MSVGSTARKAARAFEPVQDAYEAKKNRGRRAIIKQVIPTGGVGAELGVHKGHLTKKLFEWVEPTHLYVVDPWHLLGPTWDWAAGDKSTVNGMRTTAKRIGAYLGDGRAELVIDDDREFLARLDDGALDWVYLDSSHAYDQTIEELTLLVRKVRSGGVIAGDDWNADPAHRHHGVCKAVREFEATGQLEVFLIDEPTKQWAARVPPA
jgi:hypothetical protein